MDTQNVAAMLSERALGVESSGIRRVFDLGARLKDPINFSIGQPDFPVPAEVRAAAVRAIEEGRNRYTPTQGIEPLRARVARKLQEVNNVTADVDDVLITSGSSGGIFLAYAALLDRAGRRQAHLGRDREVGLPDREVDRVLELRAQVEDPSDAGALDPERALGKHRRHVRHVHRDRSLQGDQPSPGRHVAGLRARGRAQLGQDRGDVELDGVLADAQAARDRLVR